MNVPKLLVHSTDLGPLEFPLTEGKLRVGSDRHCELHIPHSEVSSHAITIEVRGANFFIENRSPFALYLGEEAVQPNSRSVWRIGTTLGLTRSVSLTITDAGSSTASRSTTQSTSETTAGAAPATNPMRAVGQIAVTLACVLVGLFIIMDSPSSSGVEVDSWENLSEAVAAKVNPSPDEREVWRRLQAAWVIEQRAESRSDAKRAVGAYQLVLDHRLIRAVKNEHDSLGARIKAFTVHRLAVLSE